MNKIAAVGSKTSVYGFAALGLDVFFAESAEELAPLMKRLKQEEYAIIYITEEAAELIKDELAQMAQDMLPAVIPVPGALGGTGLGMRAVKENMIKAIGSDI